METAVFWIGTGIVTTATISLLKQDETKTALSGAGFSPCFIAGNPAAQNSK